MIVCQRDALKVHRRELQRRALLLEMREHAVPGVRLDAAGVRHPADRGEAGRMNTRSWFGDDPVSDREHGRIAADHQGNQDHGRGTDRRRLRQDPASDAKVLQELFEPRRYPDGSSVLFRERDAAERVPSGGRGLCGRQAAVRLQPCLLSQVEPDLVVNLPIRCCGKIQRPLDPDSKSAPPRHRSSPLLQAGPSTLAMAADKRLQRVRSSASWRRPAAVMR